MASYKVDKQEFNKITLWLKRIFSWKVLMGIITILGFYFAYNQFLRETGGDITMSLNGQEVFNNEKINNIVFVDSRATRIDNLFVPSLVNNKEYSVKDFLLQYDVISDNVVFTPSDFYTQYHSGEGMVLRYKDNTLYPFSSAESPMAGLTLTDDAAKLIVKMRATYNGISQPYSHEINTLLFVEPNRGNLPFDSWKQLCKEKVIKRTDALRFNTYYIAQNNTDYETVVTTLAIEEISSQKSKANQEKKQETIPTQDNKASQPTTTHQYVNSLEIPKLQNAPINITAIDTITLSDGSLDVTVRFDPVQEYKAVYMVFDFIKLNNHPRKKRHYIMCNTNLYSGYNYCNFSFTDYHKYYDKLRFIGFATPNDSLAQFIEIEPKNNSTLLCNNSEEPIGIEYTNNANGSSQLILEEEVTSQLSGIINPIKYYQIPTLDWRKNGWERFYYDVDGSTSICGVWLVLLPIYALCGIGWIFGIIYLSDVLENKFKSSKRLFNISFCIVTVIVILVMYFLGQLSVNYF